MQAPGITVLIVDDHQLVRLGIRRILEEDDRFEVVGEASNVVEAIRLADSFRPRVIVLDVQLRGLTGLELLPILRKRHPRSRVVMLSVEMSDEQLYRAVRFGASAYLTKDENPNVIISTIAAVAAGDQPINTLVLGRPVVAVRVLDSLRAAVIKSERELQSLPLSLREIEVLDCIIQGYTNRDTGNELFITEQTVKNHVTSILRKVGAEDRTGLLREAVLRGWVTFGSPAPAPASTDCPEVELDMVMVESLAESRNGVAAD